MLKKVFSKALLSVVMDKKARSALDAAKERAKKAPPSAAAPEALPASAEELRAAARQALESAEKELASKPKLTGERKALIQQALAVRKQKTKILDELGPDQKIKLQAMALEAFGLDPTKGGR
ncbi:hypothetical protein RJ527_13415 [Thalassospiraceae bacterium LMO-SO8]|nr:hypothetical protein [Alphaproteobacteria bacterium LMO-S08]WND75035.1 hypothetical protein RJ527_13415 [Thalassospiraceae bacterium LMO-SO8]